MKTFSCKDCGGAMLPQVGHWEKVVWRNVFLHVPPDFGIPSCVDCKRPDLSDKLGEELARLQKARGVKPLQDRRLQHMKYASRGYSARGCPCRLCVQDGWARDELVAGAKNCCRGKPQRTPHQERWISRT